MKVCIGLSGGVDSSVAALLLKQQGYDVFALFMQNWHDASTTLHGDCEWEEDRFVAEMVAKKIGIPFHFVDLSGPYRQRVVDYMFSEYEKGRTPNPDVLCNREIKFDAFWQEAKRLGADMVATGHYCRKEVATDGNGNPLLDADGKPIYRILAGTDPNKDQTYFLCQLNQEQLSTAVFPIGDIIKPEVRRLAKEADLPSAEKKDSQGICFVGKVDLPTFLQQKLKSVKGDIIEVYDNYYTQNSHYLYCSELCRQIEQTRDFAAISDEQLLKLSTAIDYSDIVFETETYRSGKKHIKKTRYKEHPFAKIVGQHDGAQFYTIGQRRGLAVGGHAESVFVISTDTEKNLIYVGEGHNHKGLLRSCLRVAPEEIHWIRQDLRMEIGEQRDYLVRIRYRQPLEKATLIMRENGLYIYFDNPQRGITPGQFAVWYSPDLEMLGSGVI